METYEERIGWSLDEECDEIESTYILSGMEDWDCGAHICFNCCKKQGCSNYQHIP